MRVVAGADLRHMGYGFDPPVERSRPTYVLRISLRIHHEVMVCEPTASLNPPRARGANATGGSGDGGQRVHRRVARPLFIARAVPAPELGFEA